MMNGNGRSTTERSKICSSIASWGVREGDEPREHGVRRQHQRCEARARADRGAQEEAADLVLDDRLPASEAKNELVSNLTRREELEAQLKVVDEPPVCAVRLP